MTTYLSDIFPEHELRHERAKGYVREQVHPEFSELRILNYTERAQFDMRWNAVTEACRGLIYNASTGTIVARPFAKFHNFDDNRVGRQLPVGPVLVSEKFDGSLGILYMRPDGDLAVATRGSFASDQAKHATQRFDYLRWADESYRFAPKEWKTYLFEVIYPENRIVVDYGSEDTLVLLDVIDTATGASDVIEFDTCGWPWKADRTYLPGGFDYQSLMDMTREGDEGLVVYWPGADYRVKIKRADYVELHRIVTGMSERVIWRLLGAGKSVEQICEPLPDEFYPWVERVAERLLTERVRIMTEARREFRRVEGLTEGKNRAAFAVEAQRSQYTPYLFMLKDGRDDRVYDAVWDKLQPRGVTNMHVFTGDAE